MSNEPQYSQLICIQLTARLSLLASINCHTMSGRSRVAVVRNKESIKVIGVDDYQQLTETKNDALQLKLNKMSASDHTTVIRF